MKPILFLTACILPFLLGCNTHDEVAETPVATAVPTFNCYGLPADVITNQDRWSSPELAKICSLWLGALAPMPDSPSNAVADNPQAAELGEKLFFDPQFSSNGEVSCATCHDPAQKFTDGNVLAIGVDVGERNSPTVIGNGYGTWFFWDGHKDSLWAQALEPIESAVEHGIDREIAVEKFTASAEYMEAYQEIFGRSGSDSEKFVNMGKAIAAYERTLMPTDAPFDKYVAYLIGESTAEATLTEQEQLGLELFVGDAKCIDCHNTPLMTNNEFANTAVAKLPESARIEGVQRVLNDEFNCESEFSDAESCDHLTFIKTDQNVLLGAFKTPTLRNISDTAPYFHDGSASTLQEVLTHYNESPEIPLDTIRQNLFGHSELESIQLSAEKLNALEAFLGTLSSPTTNVDE